MKVLLSTIALCLMALWPIQAQVCESQYCLSPVLIYRECAPDPACPGNQQLCLDEYIMVDWCSGYACGNPWAQGPDCFQSAAVKVPDISPKAALALFRLKPMTPAIYQRVYQAWDRNRSIKIDPHWWWKYKTRRIGA